MNVPLLHRLFRLDGVRGLASRIDEIRRLEKTQEELDWEQQQRLRQIKALEAEARVLQEGRRVDE